MAHGGANRDGIRPLLTVCGALLECTVSGVKWGYLCNGFHGG